MKINAKPSPPEPAPASSFRYAHTGSSAAARRGNCKAARPSVRPSVLGVSRLARRNHTQTMVNEQASAAAASEATQLRGWIEPGRAVAALIHTHRFLARAKCVFRGPLPAPSPTSRTCGLLCRYAGKTCVCSHLSVRYSPYATSRCR